MARAPRPLLTSLDATTIAALAVGIGGGGGSDRELVPVTYRVKTAFAGASVGDILTSLRVIDVSAAAVAQDGGTIWYNETTAAVLASAPAAGNIEQAGTPGLTNAQFLAGLAATASPSLGDVIQTTPVLDTAAYAAGDVLFDRTAITNAVPANGGRAILQSLTLMDKDDQGAAMDLFILDANVALGTINVAPSITDANGEAIHYVGSIAAGDWIDLGGCRVASVKAIGLMVEAGAASRDLYIAAITRGTPTHTAAGIVVKSAWVQF